MGPSMHAHDITAGATHGSFAIAYASACFHVSFSLHGCMKLKHKQHELCVQHQAFSEEGGFVISTEGCYRCCWLAGLAHCVTGVGWAAVRTQKGVVVGVSCPEVGRHMPLLTAVALCSAPMPADCMAQPALVCCCIRHLLLLSALHGLRS